MVKVHFMILSLNIIHQIDPKHKFILKFSGDYDFTLESYAQFTVFQYFTLHCDVFCFVLFLLSIWFAQIYFAKQINLLKIMWTQTLCYQSFPLPSTVFFFLEGDGMRIGLWIMYTLLTQDNHNICIPVKQSTTSLCVVSH